MKGDYPRFRAAYSHEELAEQFLLTPTDLELISQCRGDINRHGIAVLLKSLLYLGYFPNSLRAIPSELREFIAKQLGVAPGTTSRAVMASVAASPAATTAGTSKTSGSISSLTARTDPKK
jgi:hypothetical protein